ncbi:MAG: R3H domain-containing nucleic acid-binding protein [Armatimonadota bacterium]|nr:R3H domain-containing nucleic acid-binding protein [Armatimonadota bacterium]MDR7533809.1 R3H domain-containing nucleic acid-binding protein [Armatimonadota bacterium]MDR7536662.1 R3H domain-containing nucleic acid-binding protein [Armatimonadota bacterium]
MTARRIQITDDLHLLLEVLPPELRAALERRPDLDHLLEVVLDLGRRPEARFPNEALPLSDAGVTRAMLDYVIERVGTFGKDNRAGIERTLHRISAIRNRRGEIIGLTCRVGRAVFGTVDIIRDVIESGRSILLLGRPGVGKTTLLREAARVLADELRKRVVIVDTSNEIAGDGDIPHPGIGAARRMQVPVPTLQHAVMIEAVENHMPEVIVIDEIGTEAEALAARTIAERGVQLIATAHGNTLDNLLQNPTLSDLVGGIQAVTLSDEEARRRGTQKTVLERKAPPTFDVVIEIQEQDRLAVHHDVAAVVDRYLRGVAPRPELRVRTAGGEVEISAAPAPTPRWAPEGPFAPAPAEDHTRPGHRLLRIYPYAVSRNRLERAIRELRVPAYVVDSLGEADLVLTLKSQEKRQPRRLREAAGRGVPVHILRSNTVTQIQEFLREVFEIEETAAEHEAALTEVEQAIAAVFESAKPVELSPQNAYIRRLQHQLVQRYGLASESKGDEPFRRVVIFPK